MRMKYWLTFGNFKFRKRYAFNIRIRRDEQG